MNWSTCVVPHHYVNLLNATKSEVWDFFGAPWAFLFQEIFQRWDVHGSGVITRKRLTELLTEVAGKSVTVTWDA